MYFVNRLDCCNTRALGNTISLIAPNGTAVATKNITYSGSVSTFTFNDFDFAPIYPNPNSAFQLSTANQNTLVRYVRIVSAPYSCLHFRELMVLDATLTNVALYKNTTSSHMSYTDPVQGFVSVPANGVNGVIDMDNVTGDMVNHPCDGSGWWQVRAKGQ